MGRVSRVESVCHYIFYTVEERKKNMCSDIAIDIDMHDGGRRKYYQRRDSTTDHRPRCRCRCRCRFGRHQPSYNNFTPLKIILLMMSSLLLLTTTTTSSSCFCHGFSSSSSSSTSFLWTTRTATTKRSSWHISPFSSLPSHQRHFHKKMTQGTTTMLSSEDDEYKYGDENPSSSSSLLIQQVLPSFVSDILYGMGYVHTNFLKLCWRLYTRSVLILLPFIVLLFIILPTISMMSTQSSSSSSSSLLTLESIMNIQTFLRNSMTIMSKFSDQIYLKPLLIILSLIPIKCFGIGHKIKTINPSNNNNNNNAAWSDLLMKKKQMKLWGLFWAPIFEELFFRYGIYKLWTAMFRPLPLQTTKSKSTSKATSTLSSSSSSQKNKNDEEEETNDGSTNNNNKNKNNKNNNTWMIISGIWFGVSHFRNFLPILDAAIDNNRFINYCDIAGPERFLIKLIPSKFLLFHNNNININNDSIVILSQFISINIILIGALFQAIHCYLNTIQLYGPLFMKTTNNNKDNNNGGIIGDRGGLGRCSGGIGSSIGAHIIWNINVSGLIVPFILNIQIRILFRIMKQIVRTIPNQKRKRKRSN